MPRQNLQLFHLALPNYRHMFSHDLTNPLIFRFPHVRPLQQLREGCTSIYNNL